MYINTIISAAIRALLDLATPISCPSITTTRHVSVSQGPSSGVYIVERKLLHCWHAHHALSTKLIIYLLNQLIKWGNRMLKYNCVYFYYYYYYSWLGETEST
jgi:hypothetical protein